MTHTPQIIKQAKIFIYEDRAHQWRFNIACMFEGGVFDIIVQSSDSYTTRDAAETMARAVACHNWQVIDDGDEPVAHPSPGRLAKIVAGLLAAPGRLAKIVAGLLAALGRLAKIVAGLLAALVILGMLVCGILSISSCVNMPRVDGAGRIVYQPSGMPQMETISLWNASAHSKMIAVAKDFDLPDCGQGSSWVEDAGKAAGLLLLAAGIVFAIARDPIKGILAAAGGGALYLCTVFLSSIASALGIWVRDVVPWIMTAGLVAAIAAIVYAGWHYRAVVTGLIKGFEVQKERIWSEPETEAKVKDAQGKLQPWISKARKKILASRVSA